MILQPRDGRLLLIQQTDHAALSGHLAAHWGNAAFARPEPRSSVLIAATHHDDGWRLWEAAPRVDPRTHRPYQFTDLPIREHAAFYLAGIEDVSRRDLYAGLLVCLHLAGLYQRRFGTDLSIPLKPLPPEEEGVRQDILHDLEARQGELRDRLAQQGHPAPAGLEGALWANYQLLQVFDRLSLYFCVAPPRPARLGPAPLDAAGRETDLDLRPVDGRRVNVSPYPFDVNPLSLAVRAHVVADRDYRDDDDFRQAFAAAAVEELRFEVRGDESGLRM